MTETSPAKSSDLNERSAAVALIVLTRYLASRDPDLPSYLADALKHAKAANLSSGDLATLALIVGSIGK